MHRHILSLVLVAFTLQACHHIPAANVPIKASPSTQNPDTSEADALLKQHRYEEATAHYKLLRANHPNNQEVSFKLAESLRLGGKPSEAETYYKDVLKAASDASHAKEGLALALLQQHKYDASKTLLLELLKEDATRWRTINALGILHSVQDKAKDATAYFEMALAIAPEEPAILNNMGLAGALTQENAPSAIETLKEALILARTEAQKKQVTLNLALAHGIAGNDEQAKRLLEPFMPESAIYNNLGIYASLRDDKELAKTYLSKALTSQPVFYEKAWENLEKIRR